MDVIVEKIKERFPDAFLGSTDFRGERSVQLKREHLREVCRFLYEDPEMAFDYMVHVSSIDWLDDPTQLGDGRFEVVYEVYSIRHRNRLRIKSRIPEEDATVDSLCEVWKGAEFMEREVYDMMGIQFKDHPDLRRILMPDDYEEGYPLRKDFPLRGMGWRDRFDDFLDK